MSNPVRNYFSEFGVLKSASRDFWLTNAIQFFDGLAYFSMVTVLSIYLTTNCGFNDVDAGAWFGIYMLFVTAFMFGVGSICDVIGIKKSYFIGFGLLALARLGLGVVPVFLHGEALQWVVKGLLLIMSLGTAFIAPVTMTSLRRYTTKSVRATGFNVYYLLMNIGAIIANALIVDGFAKIWGDVDGKLAILDFGFLMSLCAVGCTALLREDNYAEDSERATGENDTKRPLHILLEVWKERAFQKLLLFLVLTIGVRLVFTNQMLVMPKYYTRVLYTDFELGLASSINPFIIVLGLIAIIPIINRFATVRLIIIGMAISAFSLVFLALPLEWVLRLPGIHNITQAYLFVIVAQIVVFAFGELIFMPRFTEYIASVSPPDKVSSYMALAALPMFIAKPINGFVSGILISKFCYDGIRPKIDTGNIAFRDSPEFMWVIYLILAALSPLAVIALRKFLTQQGPEVSATPVNEGGTP
ncbi:MAG: MFS transporter [Verrucomicrobiota bacterium]